MLKTNSNDARRVFREWRTKSETVHNFVCFMHQHYPREEMNQYTLEDWRACARLLEVENSDGLSREGIYQLVAARDGYQETLRILRD